MRHIQSLQKRLNSSTKQNEDNAKEIAVLKQQLAEAQAQLAETQIKLNIVSFQLESAKEPATVLSATLQEKDEEILQFKDAVSSLQTERNSLLGLLENIRVKFLPQSSPFDFGSNSFLQSSSNFLATLSSRFLRATPDSISLQVRLEEYEAANRDYAREARENRLIISRQQQEIADQRRAKRPRD